MRGGNFSFRLKVPGGVYIVHRGVSQGGRDLDPQQRDAFWRKRGRLIFGVEGGEDKDDILVSLAGLRVLREKHLVLVSNPEKPRVWTARRIMDSAERVGIMPTTETPCAPKRRGGLKL